MKEKKAMVGLMIVMSGVAFRSAEAAHTFNNAIGSSALEVFRNNHPIAMVFANIGVIGLVMGVCAVVFAVLAKGPNDL